MKDRKRFHNKSEADIFHNLKVAIYSVIEPKSFNQRDGKGYIYTQLSWMPWGPSSLYSVLDMNPLLIPWSTTKMTLAATCAPRNPASSIPESFHSGK